MANGSPNPQLIIDEPAQGGEADVSAGALCVARGRKNDDSLTFEGIFLRLYAGHVTPTAGHFEEVLEGTGCYDAIGDNWMCQMIMGEGIVAGDATLMGIGQWVDDSGGMGGIKFDPAEIPLARHFTANEVEMCMAAAAPSEAAVTGSSVTMSSDIQPLAHEAQEGWYTYSLQLTSRWGNRLLLPDGRPLRATVLAVAATRVNWRFDNSRFAAVQRPFGTLDLRPMTKCVGGHCQPNYDWNYVSSPAYALVVTQSNRGAHNVFSEDRDRPDYVHLYGDRDVIVNVNNLRLTRVYGRHEGTVEIAVKVLF